MHSGDLVPFQEFGSLSSQPLMDGLATTEVHKETKGEGESYGGTGKPICTLEICYIRALLITTL